jgi:hypothetical protein
MRIQFAQLALLIGGSAVLFASGALGAEEGLVGY